MCPCVAVLVVSDVSKTVKRRQRLTQQHNIISQKTWNTAVITLKLESKEYRVNLTHKNHIYEIWGHYGGIKVMVFWDVKPCSLMNIFGRLGGTCSLHLQGDPCHASSISFCIPVVTCIFFLLPYAYYSWIFWPASFLFKSPPRRFLMCSFLFRTLSF